MFSKASYAIALGSCLLAAVCFLATSGTVQAAGSDGPRFNASTQGFSEADVDNGGKYSITKTSVTASYKSFTLLYLRSDYDWGDTNNMGFSRNAGTPWDTLQRIALDANFNGALTTDTGWYAGATLVSGFEDEMEDSFSLLGRGGISFSLTPEWRIRAGAIGLLSPVHPMLIPMLEVNWRNETDLGLSANIGMPLSSLRYRFNDMLATRLSTYWSRDLYRLANDSSVSRKGYVEESGITTGAYVDVTPFSGLKLTAGAEVLSERSIKVYHHNGDRRSKTDVDSSVGGVFRASYSF